MAGPSNPPSGGYAMPAASATPSASAAIIRSAAMSASTSSHMLEGSPRRIVDQGELNCCVSCALGAGMEILNASWPALAPLFHYYVTRYERGAADSDGFLFLDGALQALSTAGICRNDLHDVPFSPAGETTRPTAAAYDDGKARALRKRGLRDRFEKFGSSSVSMWTRDRLQRGCPVVLGFRLPMGYPGTFLDGRFAWNDPELPQSDSGHVVLAIGYSDARQALRILDSRGPQAFDGGRWWMGYRVADSAVVREAYSMLA